MKIIDVWKKRTEKGTPEEQNYFYSYYLDEEKGAYEKLLGEYPEVFKGTVAELATHLELEEDLMGGFLDGINDSLKEKLPVEELEADSAITLDIDLSSLYYNMLSAKAKWLYELPVWEDLLSKEQRLSIRSTFREDTTLRSKKIGRNDPCPCGSGKKYKHCCME
ncbi:MAG TPA: SEC-C domain-containing protein [Tissierellia bacterium]|nr:SEC-C domain-containing protein [Tissierellia bacterium]